MVPFYAFSCPSNEHEKNMPSSRNPVYSTANELGLLCPHICAPDICTFTFEPRHLRSKIAPRHLRTRLIKYLSIKVEIFKNGNKSCLNYRAQMSGRKCWGANARAQISERK